MSDFKKGDPPAPVEEAPTDDRTLDPTIVNWDRLSDLLKERTTTNPKRKPVSMSLAYDPIHDVFEYGMICDDGTMWRTCDKIDTWQQLPPIPQDEPKDIPPE